MPWINRTRLTISVTATGGAAQTFYTSSVVNGYVAAVRWTLGATAISTAAHVAITAEQSGLDIMQATATGAVTWYPRVPANSTANAAFGGVTGAGAAPGVPVMIPVADERIKVVVTSGGAASSPVTGGRTAILDFYLSGY